MLQYVAMDIKSLSNAINNELRIEIMNILANNGKLTVKEIYLLLKHNRPRYRQTVNKSLEILKDAKLVIKSYDDDKKNIVFEIRTNKIVIDFITKEVKFEE